MTHGTINMPPMAEATQSTIDFKTGSWRFEKPVFVQQLAPCTSACPMGIDIPATMSLVENNQLSGAHGKIIKENPFPGICGEICFHPCEKACNRGHFDQAVSIKDLEKTIAHSCGENSVNLEPGLTTTGKKVAIIGSGPAGFSCAYFLACLGHQVTIIKSDSEPEIYRAVSEEKVARKLIRQEIERIISMGIEIRTEQSNDASLIESLAKEFNAVYVSQKVFVSQIVEQETSIFENTYSPKELFSLIKKGNPPVFTGHCVMIVKDERKIEADYKKAVIREMAAGKQSALAIDIFFQKLSDEHIHLLSLEKLGSLSMEVYQLIPSVSGKQSLKEIVRYKDLNPAYFKKSSRIDPSSSDNYFTKQESELSAKRCFKCGTCTFCYNCYDYCPDISVHMDGELKKRKIDYDYCKGCGICVQECPRAAIILTKE